MGGVCGNIRPIVGLLTSIVEGLMISKIQVESWLLILRQMNSLQMRLIHSRPLYKLSLLHKSKKLFISVYERYLLGPGKQQTQKYFL